MTKKRKREDGDGNPRRSKRLMVKTTVDTDTNVNTPEPKQDIKDINEDNSSDDEDYESSDDSEEIDESSSDEDLVVEEPKSAKPTKSALTLNGFIDDSDEKEYLQYLLLLTTDMIKEAENEKNDKKKKDTSVSGQFAEKYDIFSLPKSIVENKKKSKKENSQINKRYEEVQKEMLDKLVDLNMIMALNISSVDRAKLVELYSLMVNLESPNYLDEYIKARDKLYKDYKRLLQQSKENTEKEKKFREREAEKKRLMSMTVTTDYGLEDKILNLNVDDHYKSFIYDRFHKMNMLSSASDERLKLADWLKNVVTIPVTNIDNVLDVKSIVKKEKKYPSSSTSSVLKIIKDKLDERIHGMQNVKEEILMILNQKLNNPASTNCTFALVGEPGTGKTKIVRILAEILSLPLEQISMGGINDVSQLEGHSYTYIGSKPGKIVEVLQKMKCKNGIIFFDEIDKIGNTKHGNEVTNSLLHVTDFTQNSTFHDNYIGQLPIDLSKIWFIFSLNDEHAINPILRNRMKMIKVPKYTRKDRVEIAKKLLPEIYENLAITEDIINLSSENIEYIIDKIKQEEGVRELKRAIETIMRKVKLLIDCKGIKLSFDLPKLDLNKMPVILKSWDLDILLKDEEKVYDFEKMSYII